MGMISIGMVLEINKVNEKSMSLDIFSNDTLVFQEKSFDSNRVNLNFATEFPATIIIQTSGKTDKDCIIDNDGNIVNDMYIKIIKFSINNISIKNWMLEKSYFAGMSNSGEKYNTNYLGYNGKTKVTVDGKNLFDYFLNLLTKS